MRGWKKIFHTNRNQKKVGVAILISYKIDLKEYYKRQRRTLHIIKGSIQEEDTTIVNIFSSNIGLPQYTRQLLIDLKGEINNNTIIAEDFNTPLTAMDSSSRQKINTETQAFDDALDQMYLIDIYRTFHPKAAEYTSFSIAHGTFSRLDHILGHKANLSKFKKTEIISSIFSNHNTIRLEINNKKPAKNTNTWILNNMILNQWITEEIKEEI